MVKPIVVLMPGADRERLRTSGVLPESFFGQDSSQGVELWEQDIDYSVGPSLAKTVSERPGDVPVFFGYPPSSSRSEINERTASIVRILNSVMVHVVFLDDEGDDSEIRYGHFHSFSDIIDWSRSLIEVLKVRFPNEVRLRDLENVLVVVVRGQQVRLSEQEQKDFSDIVGASTHDEIKPFRSCYFLNRELSIDGTKDDIFTENVWDIVVARLLKAFVLSREQNKSGANSVPMLWQNPGIKIWKAEECEAGDVGKVYRNELQKALASAEKMIKCRIGGGSGSDRQQLPVGGVDCPYSKVEPDAKIDRPGNSWVSPSFNPPEFVKGVENSPSRNGLVIQTSSEFVRWRKNALVTDTTESERIFASVKNDPSELLARIDELDNALNEERGDPKIAEAFRAGMSRIIQLEQRRRDLLHELSHMPEMQDGADSGKGGDASEGFAQQLRRAQRHYVGLGVGLCVTACVVSMCGWLSWQVVNLLEGSLVCTLVLISAVAAGSLLVVAVTTAMHYHAGDAGTRAFLEKCRELDRISVEKCNAVHDLLVKAVKNRAVALRRNSRLRTRALLVRIRDVFAQELHGAPAVQGSLAVHRPQRMEKFMREQREIYLSKTLRTVAIPLSRVSMENVEDIVSAWWGTDKHFREKWRLFCKQHDIVNAGHLPVSVFIPEMRLFMTDFVRACRGHIRRIVCERCRDDVIKELKTWFSDTENVLLFSGKASRNANARTSCRTVFLAKDNDPEFLEEMKSGNTTLSAVFYESVLLPELGAGSLALSFQEVPVTIERNPDLGVLELKCVEEGGRS